MGRHKKNMSLIKSEAPTILDKTVSIVDSIKASSELSDSEKFFIAERFNSVGAMTAQEQRIKIMIAELNEKIKKSEAFLKKKQLSLILKNLKKEISMENNKIIGFLDLLEDKVANGEIKNSFPQLTGGFDEN